MTLLERIRDEATKRRSRIVLPEGSDIRTLEAASGLTQNGICRITVLGDSGRMHEQASSLGLSLDQIDMIDPEASSKRETYAQAYYALRKQKGMTPEEAFRLMGQPLYFGAMMIRSGDADGSVAGAVHTTGDVLRAGIQCVGMAEGLAVVSSCFLMLVPGWPCPLTYADAGVVPDPNPEQLASIAIASAQTHHKLTGEEPVVAMLSFSTKGSAEHPLVDKVREATRRIREQAPGLKVDGELQGDAALVRSVGRKKAPESPVAGHANVLIFPNLDAANIAYKLTQRLANATALGPLIQGLKKPAMDLSRGCTAQDIMDVAAICCLLGK
ncbi:MAG TPA: phosphate acetyltransferase [bacterium]|nr:phosphate acetyltransferase [bacterium]